MGVRHDASVLIGVGELGVLRGPVPAAGAAARGDGGPPVVVRVPRPGGPLDAGATYPDTRMIERPTDAGVLEPATAMRVQGRVVDERGIPVPGARVDAGGRSLVTRKDGTFTVLVTSGTTVRVEHSGYPEVRASVRRAELEVVLRPGGGIEGRLIDQATGMRRMDFSLEASGPASASRRIRATSGLFRLLDLAPGAWTLHAHAAGRTGTLAVEVPAGTRPGEITVRDLEIALPR